MRTISPKKIKDQLNRCYMDYDPTWPNSTNPIENFKKHIRQTGGIVLDFNVETKNDRVGYGVTNIAIEDELKYTMWLMKWS